MDQIKEAFTKVKQDISFLQEDLFLIKQEINQLKQVSLELVDLLKRQEASKERDLKLKAEQESVLSIQTNLVQAYSEKTPTEKELFKPLKGQNIPISTGNDGVPTDRQTDQQTDQQTHFLPISDFSNKEASFYSENQERADPFQKAIGALESLDSIKKELRIQFKKLTEQELLVFSTLYQLEEEKIEVDYKILSLKLKLTESSIRDYIGKLTKKGIPIEKIKINNKAIHLKISPNLKKIASLQTILLLRDI
jgi:hypothetical protein